MSLAYRKLALLEKTLAEREEAARVQGYSLDYNDRKIQTKVTNILNQVR